MVIDNNKNKPNYLIEEIENIRVDIKNKSDLSELEISQELQKVNQVLQELITYKTQLRRKELSKSRYALNFNINTPNFDKILVKEKSERGNIENAK